MAKTRTGPKVTNGYAEFLEGKTRGAIATGFNAELAHSWLHPFQRHVSRIALSAGRYAIFGDTGLGKTRMELAIGLACAQHTGKPSLILTPLAVAGQTLQEAKTVGVHAGRVGSDTPVQVINYDRLKEIDASLYGAVLLDECFAPDTRVDTPGGRKYIKDVRVGDLIFNAFGIDRVAETHRREVPYAIAITFKGFRVVCSPEHPWLTDRGWTPARDIRQGDRIMETASAMRMVREGIHGSIRAGGKDAFLRAILLREMADESTGASSEGTHAGGSGEARRRAQGLAEVRFTTGSCRVRTDSRLESGQRSRGQGEDICIAESDETQAGSEGRQRNRNDGTTAADEGHFGNQLATGVECFVRPENPGLSDMLQGRSWQPKPSNRRGGGRFLARQSAGHRRQEGRKTRFARVDRVEIYEPSDTRLDRWRDADGKLYFYDLGATRHPSFSVGGCLVHNSSILKNFAGATKRLLCDKFAATPYRFCFTATPAPNDHTEIGNHSEFLGIMPMQSMLSRWFVHDSNGTAEWRLKGHAEDDFWSWVASWGSAFRKPSDLGDFSDKGYLLPPLTLRRVVVDVGVDPDHGKLIHDARLSATGMHKEMRRTAEHRAAKVREIIDAEPDEPWGVWCETDYEADAVKAVCPELTEVRGSMREDKKEELLLGFPKGDPKHLLTKSSIAGHGMNYQHCARVIVMGASYSHERVYQLLRRFSRYGQTREVIAYLISADTEWSVLESAQKKAERHNAMVENMVKRMNKAQKAKGIETTGRDADGKDWRLLFGDNVERIKEVETGSVGYLVSSLPFASLYTYTDLPQDMGNCSSDAEFFEHFEFLIPELKRVMMPGRLLSWHCMDLPSTKERDGIIGLRDFPGEIIRAFERHGLIYHSRVTIWKNPLLAATRTKALGLMHKQLVKDSAISRQGIGDYLITMRVPGENLEPIGHGNGFGRYLGLDEPTALPTDDPATNKYGHEVWQRYASPVWMDIDQTDVLPYAGARTERDERHICPLQLQVIRRGLELWSNPGDLVLDPFSGIGSTGYVALQEGRRYLGLELKESYFKQSVINLKKAISNLQPTLEEVSA